MDTGSLKASTAKLLLHMLVHDRSAENLSDLAGILGMDRKTLREARQQLVEARLIGENLLIDWSRFPTLVRRNSPQVVPFSPVREEKLPTSEEILPRGEEEITTTEELLPDSPRTRCAHADRLGSRSAQLEALNFAFGKRFPGKPLPAVENMKRLLVLTNNSAEDVDEAFESAAVRGPESPWSYVKAILERQKQTAPPVVTKSDDDLLPPNPEDLARGRRAEAAFRRLGILPADGGDKWN